MRHLNRFSALMLSIALFSVVRTTDARADEASDPEVAMSLSVSGFDEGEDLLNTTLIVGEGITKAIRMYAEPSHTLLAVVTNSKTMPKPEKTLWWRDTVGQNTQLHRVAFAKVPGLVGKTVNLQSRSYPITDTHFDIYVYGIWPDGEERDGLFGQFFVPRTFNFTLKKSSSRVSTMELGEFCCGSGPHPCTGEVCTNCKPTDLHACCERSDVVGCGNCGKIYPVCGICPFCN